MIKHSRQRDCIKAFLMTRTDHPTAETVYQNIRKEIPNISLATVYRKLSLLTEMGEIQKISTGEGPDRFDGNAAPHNHFVCRHCGRVLDLEMDSIEEINDIAGRSFQGKVLGHVTYFYGICPDCLAQEDREDAVS